MLCRERHKMSTVCKLKKLNDCEDLHEFQFVTVDRDNDDVFSPGRKKEKNDIYVI